MREYNSILIAIFLLGEVIDCLIKLGHALDLTSYQKRKGSEIISDQLEEHLKPNDSNQMLFCETTGPSSSQRQGSEADANWLGHVTLLIKVIWHETLDSSIVLEPYEWLSFVSVKVDIIASESTYKRKQSALCL